MRNFVLFACVFCLIGSAACAQKSGKKKGKEKDVELITEMDSISYIFGMGMGKNIRQNDIEGVDVDIIMAGIVDGLESDSAMKISFADGNNFVRAYADKQQKIKMQEALQEANAYMEEKAAEGNLQSLESGILYEIVVEGNGPKPTINDKVEINYEGKTIDGEIFDSSYEKGIPINYPVSGFIKGWQQVLQEMPVGSTWIATIPPHLAYGERGSPPNIGPNEVLIFKMELIDITTEEK